MVFKIFEPFIDNREHWYLLVVFYANASAIVLCDEAADCKPGIAIKLVHGMWNAVVFGIKYTKMDFIT